MGIVANSFLALMLCGLSTVIMYTCFKLGTGREGAAAKPVERMILFVAAIVTSLLLGAASIATVVNDGSPAKWIRIVALYAVLGYELIGLVYLTVMTVRVARVDPAR